MGLVRNTDSIESVADIWRERGDNYGAPYANHVTIAKMWSAVLGHDISPNQVAMCMIAVKLSRLANQDTHDDSWADIIGYGGIGRGIAAIERDVDNALNTNRCGDDH